MMEEKTKTGTEINNENMNSKNVPGILRFLRIIYIVAAVIFIGSIIRSYMIAGRQIRVPWTSSGEQKVSSALVNMEEGWTLQHATGETETISLPYKLTDTEEEIIITHDVTGMLQDGDVLVFDNNRQGIVVAVDGETVYEVNTTSLTKQLTFTDYQFVAIPDAQKAAEISLKFVNTVRDYYEILPISYSSYSGARNEFIYNDLLTLAALVILTVFLIVVVLVAIYCKANNITDSRVVDLAIFILTTIIWGFTDSYLPVLTTIPQEVIGVLCYLSIMALPIPICHFVWLSCGRQYWTFTIVAGIGTINLIVESILSAAGVFQLQNTFYSAHVLIVVVVIISVIAINQKKKVEHSQDIRILYWGIHVLALVAMVSLWLYWKKGGLHYRVSMLLGILLFSSILFCYVIIHYVNKMHETQLAISESKIHEMLSRFDELTGLPNRRSFEQKLNEVEAAGTLLEDAVLIMMDLNGLKIVNDQYGHSAGDDLIVSAAQVIQLTYGELGACFRIGGDEFVVILLDQSVPLTTYDHKFEENIAKINENSRWKLSIAKGTSHLVNSYGQRLSISDWKQEADINMYRNKVSMTGVKSRDRAKDLTDIINCIISTIEAKDFYTAAHSERVRELSYSIAKRLGVSDSTIQNIEIAAYLHDIGKIGVPDYILLKPGRLSEEEYEKIKQHTQIGASIIGQAKGMQEIADIVLHHHERWDGKGYPEGLSKEEIPLESRIIAIADSIDAMTSKRVYRDNMSLDSCWMDIKENADLMYDPAITKIVLDNWQDIVDIVMLHPKRLINE